MCILRDDAARRKLKGRAERGYTLLELVVVVSIVAVMAAVALPSMRPAEDQRLDHAVAWIAESVRFARAEAMRTGNPVHLEVNETSGRLRVTVADLSGPSAAPGAELRDPISKQPYDFVVSDLPDMRGIDITAKSFDYPSGGRTETVVFDARGLPFTKSSDNFMRLTQGEIQIALGDRERNVYVAPLTGRVTLD